MLFYFSTFIVFFLASFFEIYAFKKKDSYLIYLHLLLYCILLATFKARGLGTDSKNYEQYFYTRTGFFQPTDMEWLFSRIVEFVRVFFHNYTVLLAILSLILYKFESLIIKKWSVYPITSLFYMWATCCNYVFFVRQIVSMFIVVYAVHCINNNERWKFLFFVLIASLIHMSSIFFLLAWFVWKLKFNKKTYIIIFVMAVFVIPFIFQFLIKQFIKIPSFPAIIQTRIEIYFINPDKNFQHNLFILIKGFLNQAFLLLLLILNYSELEKIQKNYRGWFNLVWFGGIVYCTTIQIHIQLARFSYPYMVGYMILYPGLIKSICKKKVYGIIYFLILTLYVFLRFIIYLHQNNSIIPYSLYLGKGDYGY